MQTPRKRVIAHTEDYDGAIMVVDIDDTLRDSRHWNRKNPRALATAQPIPGVKALLRKISRRGVPILYLTAARKSVRTFNVAFLRQLPRGRLLDRRNEDPTYDHGSFKTEAILSLKRRYPRARLVCLGDDAYRDPQAYGEGRCVSCFIRCHRNEGSTTCAFRYYTSARINHIFRSVCSHHTASPDIHPPSRVLCSHFLRGRRAVLVGGNHRLSL